jgi:hypothetical protein
MEGEGCVDQVGVYDELGASLAVGCYLDSPENGYLWWVNGIWDGLGCEPVTGGAQGGGAVVAQ